MRFYSLHMEKGAQDPARARLVKEGFSWPAFFFGPAWLAWQRMWRELAVLAGVLVLLSLARHFSPQAGGWLSLLIALLLGFEGNGLYARALARRGYAEKGLIAAHGRDEAELRLARALAAREPEPA